MPIKSSKLPRYPNNWSLISRSIRFDRAKGRCECQGECGTDHGGRCAEVHGQPATWSDKKFKVYLTCAHLDHTPENNDPSNLRALCQKCHLIYDGKWHRNHWWSLRMKRMEEAGQLRLVARVKKAVQLWLLGDEVGK